MLKFKCFRATLVLCSLLLTTISYAANPSPIYNNVFISYVSPTDVATLATFVNQKQLGGYIVWTLQGDTNPVTDPTTSLLAKLKDYTTPNHDVTAYWTNWGIYNTERATAIDSYPIPGSYDAQGNVLTNDDLVAKLPLITSLTYAFLEASTDASKAPIGTVYFNDPWADLLPDDSFCNKNNPSCLYAVKSGKTLADSAKLGNFEAFAALPTTYYNLDTLISIGGYGHDDSFEAAFTDPSYMQNFARSVITILNFYHLSGVDLDYENPNMTPAQSQQFLQLVLILDKLLPTNKYITVTVLANPDYLKGTETHGTIGFAPGTPSMPNTSVLTQIAALRSVRDINLMTYDFHGAFDYTGNKNGRTGFLSNIYAPTDAPAGYNPKFSVDSSVQALLDLGVDPTEINIGLATYGRALANITPDNAGLFQVLNANTLIPGGDLDAANCDNTVPLNVNSCSGSFTYNYIVNHMLKNGFTAVTHTDNSQKSANGSTAFASSFAPGGNYTLEITNTGDQTNAGVIVSIGDFVSDYLANSPSGDKIYSASTTPSTQSIQGSTRLNIHWQTWNAQGDCLQTFDFTHNTHIMIKATNENNPSVICAVAQWD